MISANKMRKIAEVITTMINRPGRSRLGFHLMIFPFHHAGTANFITNAERESLIKALEKHIAVLKDGSTFPAPEEN